MLTIHSKLVETIVSLAAMDHPIETCGLIAGPAGSNRPMRIVPMRNAARSETFFEFDSQQYLRVWREMEANAEEPVVIYHSHTNSQAYPSRRDIELATEPMAHYVIIPTDPAFENEIRSFRIFDGRVTEERVHIVNAYKAVQQPVIETNFMASFSRPEVALT